MNSAYKHLFFDLDKTITPARQPMRDSMLKLLTELPHSKTIVSGSHTTVVAEHCRSLVANKLSQNGNHAFDSEGTELWYRPLTLEHQKEILEHIDDIVNILEHDLNEDWKPVENRGAQITFSPIGNVAPVDIKMKYDPDAAKRLDMLARKPFASQDLVVKIGGSTSFDYFHKEHHKGSNIERFIALQGWNKDECVYFGDGLFPGGNDEAVIGYIDTVPVDDEIHTEVLLREMFLV